MALASGNYFIVNTFQGAPLAVNFLGPDSSLTVAKYEQTSSQVWAVSKPTDGLQSISPANAQDQYVLFQDDNKLVTKASSKGVIWFIDAVSGSDNEYSVGSEDVDRVWDLQEAKDGGAVTWHTLRDARNDLWKFVPVSAEKGTGKGTDLD